MKSSLRALLIIGVTVFLGVLGSAQADPVIIGTVSFGGTFTPIDDSGTEVGLDVATGIDFGTAIATSATDDLADWIIPFVTFGVFTDFQFSPSLDPNPVNPLWTTGTFWFNLGAVSIVFQSETHLSLEGTGILQSAGFDPTPFAWSFSGDTTGGVFAFSQTNASVPEPASLLLLSGGLGLVALLRKRF